jgi:shikimate kinase
MTAVASICEMKWQIFLATDRGERHHPVVLPQFVDGLCTRAYGRIDPKVVAQPWLSPLQRNIGRKWKMSSCQEGCHAGDHLAQPKTPRRIVLVGVACVGKTTIGAELANLLEYRFYDLDSEVEAFYGTSIERLQQRCNSMSKFRTAAAKVLEHILSDRESGQCVVALPPRGLMGAYWNVVLKYQATTVAIHDKPENILSRIVFFDVDSRPMKRDLSAHEQQLYLKEIKMDISYFRRSYKKATLSVNISGLNVEESAHEIKVQLNALQNG